MRLNKSLIGLAVVSVFGTSSAQTIQGIDASQNDFSSKDDLTISNSTNVLISANNGHSVTLTGSTLTFNAKTVDGEKVEMQAIRAGSGKATVANTIILGGSSTKTINATLDNSSGTNNTSGIIAQKHGHIKINGDTVTVNVIGNQVKDTYGIAAQGFGGKTDPLLSKVEVNAKKMVLNVKGKPDGSAAIMAYGRGHVQVNGDLEVNTAAGANAYAIVSRGYSLVEINPKGGSLVQMNGGVAFAYNEQTSGTPIDANVIINLDRPDSYWHGNAEKMGNPPTGKDDVTGMELKLSNKAEWTTDGDSFLNLLEIKDGIVNLAGDANQEVIVDSLKGTGGNIAVASILNDDQTIESGTLSIKNSVSDKVRLNVTATGFTSDNVKDADTVLQSLNEKITTTSDSKLTKTLNVAEGDVIGAIQQEVDEAGNRGTITQAINSKLDGYSSIATLSAVQWRHETDTLLKRMGELRDAEGTVGAWARIYGSEQEYGAQSVKAKNTTIQVGSDYDIGAGWKVGGAFSYTDGSSIFDRGQSDNKMYGLSLYGTYLADNGLFVDLIGKYSRLSNDFTSGTMKGDFDNNAFSIAAETGWHYAFNTLGFVEPSVGVTYGRIMGDDFVADNGVKVEQDDYDSLIGRVGVRGGFYFPEQKGNIYARVAVLHDFMGDMEATASKYNKVTGLNTSHLKEELGDTWIEYGIGANFKLAKNAYTFVDLEKTAGSAVKENWKWTIGARYTF